MKNKKSKGLSILFVGVVLLVLSLLLNRYIEISDIFCLIFMVLAIGVEVLGLVRIVKDIN